MSNEILVNVEGVSKKFCKNLKRSLLYGLGDTFTSLVKTPLLDPTLRKDEFWAVDDVSFELRRGDCLGLIGHNGAGKSTLLKMLNGIIRPDKGRIMMKGRIGALIELGAGFNPILSGRENIYNSGAVLGYSKREIDRKLEAIIDFSEIEKFIDTPLRNYSSGMKVRLGFAVASQLNPDILIVDEVLAVGDLGFKIKCFNEIYRMIENAAVILVSHSMPQVAQVCRTAIVMNDGKTLFGPGQVSDAIVEYYNRFGSGGVIIEGSGRGSIDKVKIGNGNQFTAYDVGDEKVQPSIAFDNVDNVFLDLELRLNLDVANFEIIISISDIDQKLVSQIKPAEKRFVNSGGSIFIRVEIDSLLLNTGSYTVSVHVSRSTPSVDRGEIVIGVRNVLRFSVKADRFVGKAPVLYNSIWQIRN